MADAAATPPRLAQAAAALRGIRWLHVRNTILFGVGAAAFTALTNLRPMLQFLEMVPLGKLLVWAIVPFLIQAFALLFALAIADRLVDDGAARRRTYIAAALVGCIVGALIGVAFEFAWRATMMPDITFASRPWLHGTARFIYMPLWSVTGWLLLGGTAVLLYAGRRGARQTQGRLHAAELERIQQSKRVLESRLQTMQARVEPQFLFNTLAQVGKLYESDPPLASRLLSELISYLRAAMPLMRSTTSTVGREIGLVRNYLEILNVRLGNRLAFAIDASAQFEDVEMPPMMLLPLVDHAIVHGLEKSRSEGTITIRIDLSVDRLRMTIVDSGAGFVPDSAGDGIAGIRERLEALYGRDAQLDLRARNGGGTEAVMEIPCTTGEGRSAAPDS